MIASSRLSIIIWTSAGDRIDTLPAESISWIGITRLSLPLLLLPVFYAFLPPLFSRSCRFLSKTGIVPVADAPVPDSRALRAIS